MLVSQSKNDFHLSKLSSLKSKKMISALILLAFQKRMFNQ